MTKERDAVVDPCLFTGLSFSDEMVLIHLRELMG